MATMQRRWEVEEDAWELEDESAESLSKFNPYHHPAGSPKGGQFAEKPGGKDGKVEGVPASIANVIRSTVSGARFRLENDKTERVPEARARVLSDGQDFFRAVGGVGGFERMLSRGLPDGHKVVVTHIAGTGSGTWRNVHWLAEVRARSGEAVGWMNRDFVDAKYRDDGVLTVLHNSFRLTEQGKGLAKHIIAGSVRAYQKMGYSRIEMDANAAVGGYAWARYGFGLTYWTDDIGTVRERAYSGWERELGTAPSPAMRRLLDHTPRSQAETNKWLWAIADSKYGKTTLLGSHYSAYLDFNDKAMMKRYRRYIGR